MLLIIFSQLRPIFPWARCIPSLLVVQLSVCLCCFAVIIYLPLCFKGSTAVQDLTQEASEKLACKQIMVPTKMKKEPFTQLFSQIFVTENFVHHGTYFSRLYILNNHQNISFSFFSNVNCWHFFFLQDFILHSLQNTFFFPHHTFLFSFVTTYKSNKWNFGKWREAVLQIKISKAKIPFFTCF